MSKKISRTDADHFDREGFSGDIYIPKSQEMGFNALLIEVDGRHPKKRILKGNTRAYFVVRGQGSFTLDDKTHEAKAGDLFVVETGSTYEYDGKMQLFEFNVSPDNSFGDEKLD
jgi:mannose-6-phosphate isomerase-like protein (cupin superfamily)